MDTLFVRSAAHKVKALKAFTTSAVDEFSRSMDPATRMISLNFLEEFMEVTDLLRSSILAPPLAIRSQLTSFAELTFLRRLVPISRD